MHQPPTGFVSDTLGWACSGSLPGVCSLWASLGVAGGRRVVLGHAFNTLRHNHKKSHKVFSKFLILCWAACSPRAVGWTPGPDSAFLTLQVRFDLGELLPPGRNDKGPATPKGKAARATPTGRGFSQTALRKTPTTEMPSLDLESQRSKIANLKVTLLQFLNSLFG